MLHLRICIIFALASLLISESVKASVVHVNAGGISANAGGIWKKKVTWKPRWVKSWQERRYYVAVWKRTWSPVEVNEWVPFPKPPPGWLPH